MNWQKLTYDEFFPALLEAVPEFVPFYNEHIVELEELLDHVLLADFTRFVVAAYKSCLTAEGSDATVWCDIVRRSLMFLENAFATSDPELWNLIAVSFVENLMVGPDNEDVEVYLKLHGLLGPKLRRQLEEFDPLLLGPLTSQI